MSILNTISGVSNSINVGGSALNLIPATKALVSKKDGLKRGIEGFLFDIVMTDQVNNYAQITDHFLEDNSFVQDHIAIAPIKITITGRVAELVRTKVEALAFLSASIDRLGNLDLFSPTLGLKARQAIAAYSQLDSALESAKKTFTSLKDYFNEKDTLNKQQEAFKTFSGWFENRALLSVETPWKTFTNMAIESWTADQDEVTNMETLFTLNFKEMRFINTTTNTGKLYNKLTKSQQAKPLNKGRQGGKGQDKSILYNIFEPLLN